MKTPDKYSSVTIISRVSSIPRTRFMSPESIAIHSALAEEVDTTPENAVESTSRDGFSLIPCTTMHPSPDST